MPGEETWNESLGRGRSVENHRLRSVEAGAQFIGAGPPIRSRGNSKSPSQSLARTTPPQPLKQQGCWQHGPCQPAVSVTGLIGVNLAVRGIAINSPYGRYSRQLPPAFPLFLSTFTIQPSRVEMSLRALDSGEAQGWSMYVE